MRSAGGGAKGGGNNAVNKSIIVGRLRGQEMDQNATVISSGASVSPFHLEVQKRTTYGGAL